MNTTIKQESAGAAQAVHRDIGRILDASLLRFDIAQLLNQIKAEDDWKKEDRNAIILYKSPDLRVVLVAMHAGTAIKPHTANHPFSLQVVEGIIRFRTDSQDVSLGRGQMITLHAGVPHELYAPEEAAFLMTLAMAEAHPAE